MNDLPPEIISQILLQVLGTQVQLQQIVKLSHTSTRFKKILCATLYYWKDIILARGDPNWILENCKILEKITSIQARGNDRINQGNLQEILTKCENLKKLDLSNCNNISIEEVKMLIKSDMKLEYLDITGIGKESFQSFEDYHDYWFVGRELIRDLEELCNILPERTLIMPSICQKCKRDTCYPPDIELKCLFCDKHVWWVCDDCELEAYRICYQCVHEDGDNGIDTVICYNCLQNHGQKACLKCEDWKCPNHVKFDCGCTEGSV